MANISQSLIEDGFAVIPSVFTAENCVVLKTAIQEKINQLMHSHDCSKEIYFSAVNRWPLNQLVDEKWQEEIVVLMAKKVSAITGLALKPFEIDILYKSPYANLPTPCHQDISYAFNRPYLFSTWLALTDVSINESPLQFLSGSQQNEILPAVDFWNPGFIDKVRSSSIWQTQNVTVPVSIGDALIFSSSIWHASNSHQAMSERWALIIRWGDEHQLPHVPRPQKVKFGMWNCGEYTERLLIKGLQEIFAIKKTNSTEAIKIWQQQLKNNLVSFIADNKKCLSALEKLRILNEAYQRYEAGDGQGTVYAEVWRELLCYLEERADFTLSTL